MLSSQQFSKNPYQFLNNFIKNQPNLDVSGVDALLFKLTRSHIAVLMIKHLLDWFKHSKKSGMVWRTWEQWQQQCGISRNQRDYIHKTEKLERVGIRRRIIQVFGQGTPTHYYLVLDDLLQALAELCDVSVEQVIGWMLDMPAQVASGNRVSPQAGAEYSPQAYTNNTNKINKQTVVVESELTIPGMKASLTVSLIAQYGLERVQAMVEYAHRSNVRNLAAYVLRGLEENWFIPIASDQETVAETATEKDFTSGKYADFINQDDGWDDNDKMGSDTEPVVYENPDLENGKTAADAWEVAHNQLELQLDRASFDTWLKLARFMGVDDGVWVVQVHNHYAQEMLQGRLYRNVRRVVGDVAGYEKGKLELRFEAK